MARELILALALLVASMAQPAQGVQRCALRWDHVTTYTDGTPAVVAGYKVYRDAAMVLDVPVGALTPPTAPRVEIDCLLGAYTVTAYVLLPVPQESVPSNSVVLRAPAQVQNFIIERL